MAKEINVSARMVFVTDKIVAKMKKCLDKHSDREYCKHPAIEMETGMMIATTGQMLAAHKLKDYCFEPSDGAVLGPVVMLPVEVLQMKGRVEVTVQVVDGDVLTTCTSEAGAKSELRTGTIYPRWRTVIPRTTGWPIDVDAKAWDAKLKEIVPKMNGFTMCPVRFYGEAKSETMALSWDNPDTDDRGQMDVNVGFMPFKMWVTLNGKHLRDVMAMQPTAMRFTDSTRAVIFHGDDTLCLMMPVLTVDEPCGADKNCLETFDLEQWIGADLGTVVVDNTKEPKHEQTLEERLREALRRQFQMAA